MAQDDFTGSATGGSAVIGARTADVGRSREAVRLHRLRVLTLWLSVVAALLWWRIAVGHGINFFQVPHIDWTVMAPIMFFVLLGVLMAVMTVGPGRSPHVLFRPEQIDVRLDDVVGIEPIKEDVIRSLNLFLAHKQFAAEMGGTPRRGLLFEGPPGTGKTHLAKAMAAEAGVPFLFVSATSFQSTFYGASSRKVRNYFKALRTAARKEGGAIGFIEEIDAIAMARGGVSGMSPAPQLAPMSSHSCGMHVAESMTSSAATDSSKVVSGYDTSDTGMINELLVQMQSFDDPTGMQKFRDKLANWLNGLLPAHRQLSAPNRPRSNVLLVAATNLAPQLDPALLRPGRFDRRLTFQVPAKSGRLELIEFFLAKKTHASELDTDDIRDRMAAATIGYTPVMIEHLFDEALVNALRRGDTEMTFADVEKARIVEEIGLGQPVEYTKHERDLIATHESGHATVAYLFAPERRLEVLTIVKRRQALGLLAHGDREDVYTQSKTELINLIRIALGGQCAEEIFFGDVSTGPGGDLLYATNVAAQMVGAVGMMGSLISFSAVQGGAFNDSNLVGRVLGDPEGRAKVEELLQEQKVIVRAKLEEKRHLVEALRDALFEHQELIGADITNVLKAADAAVPDAVIDLRQGADAPA